MIWILLIIYGLVLLIEGPGLLKKKMKREAAVFLAFYAIGLYFSLAFHYDWPLAQPFEALSSFADHRFGAGGG